VLFFFVNPIKIYTDEGTRRAEMLSAQGTQARKRMSGEVAERYRENQEKPAATKQTFRPPNFLPPPSNRSTSSLPGYRATEAHKSLCFHLSHRHGLLVVLEVNDSRPELPGRNLALEQDVGFAVRAVLEFRKEEVGDEPADNRGTSPDVTALACEVPPSRIKHLRSQIDHRDLGNIVGGTADTGAQSAETNRGRLSNGGICDRSESTGKNEGDDDAETSLGVIRRSVRCDGGANTEKHEENDIGYCAPEVDGPATEPGGKEPRADIGNELKTRIDQTELEREIG